MRAIFKSELYKLVISDKQWAFILAGLVLKLLFSYFSMNLNVDFSPEIYRQYIEKMDSISEENRAEFLEAEKSSLEFILNQKAQKEDEYYSEIITLDQFKAFMNEYYTAEKQYPPFLEITEKYENYSEFSADDRIYYYDLNLQVLLENMGFDYVNVLLLLFLILPCFCKEYQYGIFPLIFSARFGREKLYKAKIMSCIVLSVILTILMFAADFTVFGFKFGFDNFDMKLKTVRGVFTEFNSLSVVGFLALKQGIRLLWFVASTLLICAGSVVLKNPILSAFCSAAVIIIPWFLSPIMPDFINLVTIGAGLSGGYIASLNSVVFNALAAIIHILGLILIGKIIWVKVR